jgi:two-component system sensor histidine kinase RegB
MRISVTERKDLSGLDLRPAGELAPSLALPWIVKLRYGVLVGEAVLILAAAFVFRVQIPTAWLAVPLAVTAVSNVLLPRLVAKVGARPALGVTLSLDIICLTALLALSGGPSNPFSLLYLVQITLSAVVLSKAWTWALGVLSVLGFGFLFLVHIRVAVFEAHHAGEGFSIHLIGMWMAFAAAALLITVFIGKVSEALRRREQEVLSLQGQLSRHERLASIVTLAAGAAHELSTPLATIAVASKELEFYAAGSSGDKLVAEEARLIRTEVDRCSRILRQMSVRGAEPTGETPVPVRICELLERVKSAFPEPQRLAIRAAADERLEAVLPIEATRQVLTALVSNAVEASRNGELVDLTATSDGGKLRFTVQDSGTGMTPETLNRVSEPFFTTKGPGRGMGLGTFLVRVFAENLKGSLVFESEFNAGTKAVLELPLST